MAPSSKENDVLTISPDRRNPSNTPRPDDTASRPQPVALEVPVTVNGARTVEGSDKREPFSETTKTVLVFGNGAVIRLGSSVAAGQLLFLTNEKTKKEVVCQVVKSKNYRSASGYVELEFTEPVVGFWGMRFPTDVATPVPARPATPPMGTGSSVTGVPATVKPGMVSAPRVPEPLPLPIQTPRQTQPAMSPPASAPEGVAAVPEIPAAPVVQALNGPEAPATRGPEPPVTHAAGVSSSLATSLASLLDEDETPFADRSQNKPSPSAVSNETEALKQHTARLQEQLSSMLFSSAPKNKAAQTPTTKASDLRPPSSVAKKVFDIAKSDPAPASSLLPTRPVPPPVKSSLDAEEVKIPAWLEPLARNAAAPSSTQELIEREKAKHAAQLGSREETAEEPLSLTPEETPTAVADLPTIGNLLPLDEGAVTKDGSSGKSGKGLMLGAIAAGILIAAGGGWYFLQPAKSVQNATAQVTLPVASQPHAAAPVPPSPQPSAELNGQLQRSLEKAAESSKPNPIAPPHDSVSSSAAAQPATNVGVSKPAANSRPPVTMKEKSRAASAEIPAAEKEPVARTKPEPEPEPAPAAKKQTLGEVHLASPMMNRHTAAQTEAPTLATGADVPETGGLNSGLGTSGKDSSPAAPLQVGGDVTPAKLLSQVSPSYPAMARSQHISGDVVIDALIDTNGRVTTMKVISGPTLLHQAAKDALRQWKYKPATLDGNPVSMHLTVKLQFRMP